MSDSQTPTAAAHQTYTAPPTGTPPPPTAPPPGKRSVWPWIILLAVIIGGVYYYLEYWRKPATSPQGEGDKEGQQPSGSGGKRGKGGRGGAGGALPIVAVKSVRGNIGVYYSGIGNVTPIHTVAVHTRVDGQLMSIHYNEGDIVKQNDLLAEIDPRPYQAQLTQYEGQLIRDKALLENAKVDLTRYETLLKQNAVPEQQLATQKSLVDQDEGVVKTDQGLIDSVKVNLAYCSISAPITGRVGLRLVDPGNIVHASDSNGLIIITQLQPISVIFTVAEDQLPAVLDKLHAGQKLTVEAYDSDKTHKIASGFLVTTDNVIDQTTGTLKLRANFDNTRNELFPNQFVNARMLVQMKTGVILLPTAAVQRNTQMTYAWVVKPDNTVTVRQINIGTVEGDQSEVTSGLDAGETVVMTGVDKLQEKGKVTVQYEGAGKKPAAGAPGAAGSSAPAAATGPAEKPASGATGSTGSTGGHHGKKKAGSQ